MPYLGTPVMDAISLPVSGTPILPFAQLPLSPHGYSFQFMDFQSKSTSQPSVFSISHTPSVRVSPEPSSRFCQIVRKPIRSAVWESRRREITRLWIDEDEKLDDVIQLMKEKGFDASRPQYKLKFQQWGLQKRKKSSTPKSSATRPEDPDRELDHSLKDPRKTVAAAEDLVEVDLSKLCRVTKIVIDKAKKMLEELSVCENGLRIVESIICNDGLPLSRESEWLLGDTPACLHKYWQLARIRAERLMKT